MVSKNLNEIIREIKIKDAELINQKEIESFSLERLQELKEKKLDNKIESEIKVSKVETEIKNEIKEETKNEIKEESKNEIKEESKNEIKKESKNEIKEESKNEIKKESKNEIIMNQKEEKEEEEPKEKNQTKKKKNKKKKKKTPKIFEVPQTNPYRNLFDFKDVSKSRFQDNSIFRVINNWEEKDWFQTNPPTKDIDEQFKDQVFPQGEIQPYLK